MSVNTILTAADEIRALTKIRIFKLGLTINQLTAYLTVNCGQYFDRSTEIPTIGPEVR